MTSTHGIDPKLDLVFERVVSVPRELVWRAWTRPEHVKKWFTPAPWTTVECEIDLRPGGIFRTVMRSPEGKDFPNLGAYLEVVENERLVWTNALLPGFRPARVTSTCGDDSPNSEETGFLFTAEILLSPQDKGTRYTAIVRHGDEAGRAKHEAMGFHDGWSSALNQLVAHASTM